MPRILLIHPAFVSPKQAGGTRHYEFARLIAGERYQFSIIASTLSYLTGKASTSGDDDGLVEGVSVLRAYTLPVAHRSFIWRVIGFFSFMLSSVWEARKVQNVDVVMGTTPPIFQAVSAWLVSRVSRRPLLLEVRDLWPEFAIDIGVLTNPVLIRLSRWLESFLYSQADHILVNSPAYRDYMLARGIAPGKVTLIPNGVDPTMFDLDLDGGPMRARLGLEDRFVVTYAGALGLANNIDAILRAADRLRDRADIHFLIVGDGKERSNMEALAQELNLSNVTFAGAMPKTEMPAVLAASDATTATLKDIPMFKTVYPNKVFDYMAAARPVVLGIDGVIREVVETANAGIFVPPGDDAALAAAVERLYKDRDEAMRMGGNGRAHVEEHFNRRDHAQAFADLIDRLVTR